jgi:hypothetical protein
MLNVHTITERLALLLAILINHNHVMCAHVLAAIPCPQRAHNFRCGDVVTITAQQREYERAVQVTVVIAERIKHRPIFLRVAELVMGAQVLCDGLFTVARVQQPEPGEEIDAGEQAQEQEPEPEAYEEFLVEEVDRKRALHRMLMNVIRHVSYFKVTKGNSLIFEIMIRKITDNRFFFSNLLNE